MLKLKLIKHIAKCLKIIKKVPKSSKTIAKKARTTAKAKVLKTNVARHQNLSRVAKSIRTVTKKEQKKC